jgi:hypothetical protein
MVLSAVMIRHTLICAVLFFSLLPKVSASETPLIIGLVKTNMVIVPFAIFEKGQWKNPWPKPKGYSPSDPNTISDLTSPWFKHFLNGVSNWYVWGKDLKGSKITATKIIETRSHCGTVWGLVPPGTPILKGEGYDEMKIGTAFSRNVAASFFEEISPPSALQGLVKPIFERQETEVISFQRNRFFPKTAGERGSRNPDIKAVYRATIPGSREMIELVVAERLYEAPTGEYDPTCKLVSYWEGWILGGKSAQVIDAAMTLTDCDYKEVLRARPFAIVVLGKKRFVIIQESCYESENYTIYVLDRKLRKAITTYGGGC